MLRYIYIQILQNTKSHLVLLNQLRGLHREQQSKLRKRKSYDALLDFYLSRKQEMFFQTTFSNGQMVAISLNEGAILYSLKMNTFNDSIQLHLHLSIFCRKLILKHNCSGIFLNATFVKILYSRLNYLKLVFKISRRKT